MNTKGKARIALYSHDTIGLGHIRRNLAIAKTLVSSGVSSNVLLLTGTHLTTALELPTGVDCLVLPGIAKDKTGDYRAQSLSMPLKELTQLRARTIEAALDTYQPDLFVVDKVPYGVHDELLPVLMTLKRKHKTRLILGLRDILDDPANTCLDWRKYRGDQAIRDFFDAMWIYGDPTVFDSVAEYQFHDDVAEKARFTGYLNQSTEMPSPVGAEQAASPFKFALCQVGGGQDGYAIARAFAAAPLPDGMHGRILTGPFMPKDERDELQQIADERATLDILEFTPRPELLLQQADCVLTMGGYNSTCELLAANKRALVVPRVAPRLEQWIRAQRLQSLGLLDVLHPDSLTSSRLSHWLSQRIERTVDSRQIVDLGGLSRIPALAEELLRTPRGRHRVQRTFFAFNPAKPRLHVRN